MSEIGNRSIFEVNLVSANVEYSQAFPRNTKNYRIYAMDSNKQYPHNDVLRLGFGVGGSASGAVHIPLPPAGYHEEFGLDLTNETIYFQSPTANAKVIIISWA